MLLAPRGLAMNSGSAGNVFAGSAQECIVILFINLWLGRLVLAVSLLSTEKGGTFCFIVNGSSVWRWTGGGKSVLWVSPWGVRKIDFY